MVHFIIGGAGSGKSTEIMKKINEFSDIGKNLCIIVPEQFSYEFDKNLYRYIGVQKFNQLFSLTFTALSRQLFQIYGDDNRKGVYADELKKAIIMNEALINVSKMPEGLKFFGKYVSRNGFITDVIRLLKDMKRSGITPENLSEKTIFLNGRLKDKSDDIGKIYYEYERLLGQYSLKDNLNDISEAAKIANANNYFKNKIIFIDEFENFNGDQYEMLKTMITNAKDVYIALRTENADAEEFTLFETVNRTYRKIMRICIENGQKTDKLICNGTYRYKSDDLKHLSCNILRSKKCVSPKKSENIKIFESKDYYSECEYACATIKHLIYEDKALHYNDICIISNNIADYAGVLEATFARYEIPYFLSVEKSVSHTALMVFAAATVNIASSSGYRTEELMRYLKCGILDLTLTEISLLENYCYKWGIDGNKWNRKFEADDELTQTAEAVRIKVIKPLEKLKKKCSVSNASEITKALYEHIIECKTDKRISLYISEYISDSKEYLASELKRLWGCLIDILDSISELYGNKEITMKQYKLLFDTLLSQVKYSVPPQTLDSVTVAPAQTARLNAPKIVFILGANEGSFPASISVHGLLSEEDKMILAEKSKIEMSRSAAELISDERLVVYKSLSIASDKLFISYSLSDLSGQQKYPAIVLKSITELFTEGDKMLINEADITPDFYAVTLKSAFYNFMQNDKLNTAEINSIKAVLKNDKFYKDKIEYVYNCTKQNELNQQIKNPELMEKLLNFYPMKISQTNFQAYNECPFKFFCKVCLNLFKREKVCLDTISAGNLMHNCFYNLVSGRSKNEFLEMSYDDIVSEIQKSSTLYRQNLSAEYITTPRFELNYDKLAGRLTRIAVHLQQELMVSDFVPVNFEYRIKGDEALKLPFAQGKQLEFGGIIDRVDSCQLNGNEYIRIIDYKSTKKNLTPELINNGINMQMLLYIFAMTEKNDKIPSGVLYSPLSIDKINIEDTIEKSENKTLIDSNLKSRGFVIDNKEILNAMEHNINGKFIPARLSKSGEYDKNKTSCITSDGMEKLRKISYDKLSDMAEAVYSGQFSASPFVGKGDDACKYCDYINVCGNNNRLAYMPRNNTDTSQIEEILGKNNNETETDENGLD